MKNKRLPWVTKSGFCVRYQEDVGNTMNKYCCEKVVEEKVIMDMRSKK